MDSKVEKFDYKIKKLDETKNMLNTFKEKQDTRNDARNLKYELIGL